MQCAFMETQVARNGEMLGSYDELQLIASLETGVILPTDHYWHEGMDQWEELSTIIDYVEDSPSVPANPTGKAKDISQKNQHLGWRDDPASEKQLKYLQSFVTPMTPDLTKGEASDLIDQHQNDPDAQRRRWTEAMEQIRLRRSKHPSYSIREDIEKALTQIAEIKAQKTTAKLLPSQTKCKIADLRKLRDKAETDESWCDLDIEISKLEEVVANLDPQALKDDLQCLQMELKAHRDMRVKFWRATFNANWIEDDNEMELVDFGDSISNYYRGWGYAMKVPAKRDVLEILAELDSQNGDWDRTVPEAFYAIYNRLRPGAFLSAKVVGARATRAGIW